MLLKSNNSTNYILEKTIRRRGWFFFGVLTNS